MSAATTPYSGLGTTLGVNAGGSSSYAAIGLLMDDAGFEGWETVVIPIKPLSQTVVTKVPGRSDYGTFKCQIYNVNNNAGVTQIYTLFGSRAVVAWQVMLPDGSAPTTGSTYLFSGFVSTATPGNFTGEDTPTLDVTIAISGVVTTAVGS